MIDFNEEAKQEEAIEEGKEEVNEEVKDEAKEEVVNEVVEEPKTEEVEVKKPDKTLDTLTTCPKCKKSMKLKPYCYKHEHKLVREHLNKKQSNHFQNQEQKPNPCQSQR